ncbi:hypothetical protein A9Q93_02750 [Nonlabens dokdonensis]|uniref:Uncharacterized protein n=1 Tax=Nonlabens dokdonensis TaxID=328515 RepID=A0A1Z8B992_9FLAO|nr:hypothetical protein [Nonlabens dokdonensis]OUS19110.1 hypothetical protein A9Q93_02750 [Nonlabens dokdonensis]
MFLFILLSTLVIFILYPIVAYRIYKSIRAKEKKRSYRLTFLMLFLLVLPNILWRTLPGSDIIWYPVDWVMIRNYNYELTGLKFSNGESVYKNESERAFNGDGYSINIYKLDDEVAQYFMSPNEDFFNNYPKRGIRDDWQITHWKKTPHNQSEKGFVGFAYSQLYDLNFELEDLLIEEGNYYAYKHDMYDVFDPDYYRGNIDFYIICPKRKIIVKINHNT